jgi:hypothetical protein
MAEDGVKKPIDKSRRAVILATVGIVVIMGLAVFYVAVVAPLRATHAVVRAFAPTGTRLMADIEVSALSEADRTAVVSLGGPERATHQLARYFRLPRWAGTHRLKAVYLLGCCRSRAVPVLVQILKHTDAGLRSAAAWSLGEVGPEAATAVPALIDALGDADVNVRRNTILALGKIRSHTKETVPALVEMLDDSDSFACPLAALALGLIGPEAKAAVSALEKLQNDSNMEVRVYVAWALSQIHHPAPTPAAPEETP